MATRGNIHFGGRDYGIPVSEVDQLVEALKASGGQKGATVITVTSPNGEVDYLIWTPGAPITIGTVIDD